MQRVGVPRSRGLAARGTEPGSRVSHIGAGSLRCRAAGEPQRPEGGREGECGEGSGSRKPLPPRSPFTGRADRAAGSLRGSQGHASLPSPLEVSKVGLRGVGAEGAGSHARTLEGQVGRKEGPEGLCICREPGPGRSPILLLPPLHQPAASQSSPFPESCCGSHLLQPPRETLPESSVASLGPW